MTAVALLLVMIGLADLARSLVRDQSGLPPETPGPAKGLSPGNKRAMALIIGGLWALLLIGAIWLLGLGWGWALGAALVAGAWLATTTSRENATAIFRLWPALGVLIATAIFAVFETHDPAVNTPMGHWYASSAPEWIREFPLTTLIMALGVGVFLIESTNIVVRSALYPGSIHPPGGMGALSEPLPDLRGGRLIGPLERLGLLTLTLAGMFTIVAALIAAKGIVRFPEISNDQQGGSKAEYFLVGSLLSWGVAMLGVGLIHVSG